MNARALAWTFALQRVYNYCSKNGDQRKRALSAAIRISGLFQQDLTLIGREVRRFRRILAELLLREQERPPKKISRAAIGLFDLTLIKREAFREARN